MRLSNKVYNLRFIQRYSLTPRNTSETVAEHSFFVAVIVLELADTYEFDVGIAIKMAILHDFAESELGDITLTAKQKHPGLVKEVRKAENKIMRSFGEDIYKLYQVYEERTTVESLVVKYADILQVKQYLESEMERGYSSKIKEMIKSTDDIILNYQQKLAKFQR